MNDAELAEAQTEPDAIDDDKDSFEIQTRRKLVRARGANQRAYLGSIRDNDLASVSVPPAQAKPIWLLQALLTHWRQHRFGESF